MTLLCVKDLSFKYDKEIILDRVNLELHEGEIVLLLGPNGCGKTTLLDCLVGYRQHENGSILINGQNFDRYSIKEKARQIAYVPQTAANIFPYSVLQIVLMGRTPHLGAVESPAKADIEIAATALENLGISRFKDRLFATLSGGEQQLVLIARSMAQDARIILLDEPMSSLDLKNESMVLSHIRDLVRHTRKSMIIATHQPNHAYYFAGHDSNVNVALFANKRIKYFGTPDAMLNEKIISEVYDVQCGICDYGHNRKFIVVH